MESKRCKLQDIADVKRELARIYRESRSGKMLTADLGRFANVLAILARVMSDSDLESRILALEAERLAGGKL